MSQELQHLTGSKQTSVPCMHLALLARIWPKHCSTEDHSDRSGTRPGLVRLPSTPNKACYAAQHGDFFNSSSEGDKAVSPSIAAHDSTAQSGTGPGLPRRRRRHASIAVSQPLHTQHGLHLQPDKDMSSTLRPNYVFPENATRSKHALDTAAKVGIP
jgi:hypothetical protein